VSDASRQQLEARAPQWDEKERIWLVTRYADATQVLKNTDIAIVEVSAQIGRLSARMGGEFDNIILLLGHSHPFQNTPVHEPIRNALMAFVNDVQHRWTVERLDALAGELLAPLADGRAHDVIPALARRIPTTIISDALGLAPDDIERCGTWVRELSSIWHRPAHALRELRALEETATNIVELLSARLGGEPRETFARIAFLAMAGVDTTTGLFGSALNHLARHLPLQQRLRHEPMLIPGFVNEALRCWPPLRRIIGRKALRDITLDGATIPAGAYIAIDLECAQRDPDAYAEPDRFDPARKSPPTLSFGAGPHTCAGVALARLESRVLIERLVRDFALHPAGEARPTDSPDWAGFDSLPLRLERRG
jgi:cytochrome P450